MKSRVEVPQLVLISTATEDELHKVLLEFLDHLKKNPDLSLTDVAQASNAGRIHKSFRVGLLASSLTELIQCIEEKNYKISKVPDNSSPNEIGFLFNPAGHEYEDMGKNLYESIPPFQRILDHYDKIHMQYTGVSLKESIWKEPKHSGANLVCFQMALVDLWKCLGVVPYAVMGSSAGEYGAAVSANALSLEDSLRMNVQKLPLIKKVSETTNGTIVVLKAHEVEVESIVDHFNFICANGDWAEIAIVRDPKTVVVALPRTAVEYFISLCTKSGIEANDLNAPTAYHSRAMEAILDELKPIFEEMKHRDLTCKYISAVHGREIKSNEFNAIYWLTHFRHRVQCCKAMEKIWLHCKVLIEIGPRQGLVHNARATVEHIDTSAQVDGIIVSTLRKSEMDWKSFYTSVNEIFGYGVNLDWNSWFPKTIKANSEILKIKSILWK